MHAFMEGLFPSSLTRISLGIPTSVPPNSVKSLEHVRSGSLSRKKSVPSYFFYVKLLEEGVDSRTSPFPGSLSPLPGSVLSLYKKSRCELPY